MHRYRNLQLQNLSLHRGHALQDELGQPLEQHLQRWKRIPNIPDVLVCARIQEYERKPSSCAHSSDKTLPAERKKRKEKKESHQTKLMKLIHQLIASKRKHQLHSFVYLVRGFESIPPLPLAIHLI